MLIRHSDSLYYIIIVYWSSKRHHNREAKGASVEVEALETAEPGLSNPTLMLVVKYIHQFFLRASSIDAPSSLWIIRFALQQGLRSLLRLLREEHRVDVGEHTAASDGHAAKELVELLVVAHSELHVARDDARLLVVAGSVARKLKNFGTKVLEHGSEVHWGASADAGGVLALLEEAAHASHRELQAGLRRLAGSLGRSLAASSFSFARHFDWGIS